MSHVLEKVTAFVMRTVAGCEQLLLLEHPYAGIQLPAGTVEAGEAHAAAVLREAREESGLTGLTIECYLGAADDPLPPGHVVMTETAPVYHRPDSTSATWAQLRRGLPVAVERTADDFTQVSYTEYDRLPDLHHVTMNITGWVKHDTITDQRIRHFYRLAYAGTAAERWQVYEQHHYFTLFWAPLDQLPTLIAPQDQWLAFLIRD